MTQVREDLSPAAPAAPEASACACARPCELPAGRGRGTTTCSTTPRHTRARSSSTTSLVPTTCFNCESACGLLAYVDRDDLTIKKFEGNPAHPGSRGRNCAKGPATINQVNDPERILHPLRRVGERGSGQFERVIVGRGTRRHRGADPRGDRRGPHGRGDVPRRSSRRGRLRRAGAAGLGRRRAQQPHQHLLGRRATGLHAVGRLRPAVAGLRQRQGDPAASPATSRRATTSTRTPSGSWRARSRAGRSSSSSTRGCRTPRRTPTCG